LAELRHSGIVSYVAHGSTGQQGYLAMEWLEGEELSRRLARQPLGLSETLSLLRRAAEALATAHRQGIVHRDLKPSNLFLRGGKPEEVVLLDFGLARYVSRTLVAVTGTGTVVGTPGYMAPEQASSAPEIPPAADIFSLGCVLYECLTGRAPFAAPHFAATLAKILYAQPARLEALRPGLPAGLQVLVDRMLAKAPARRLPDADSLLAALGELESVPELLPPRAGTEPRLDSGAEAGQTLVSVLLVSLHAGAREETADWNQGLALRDSLRTDLSPLRGAQVELLADGSLVATLVPERGTATDQAALAARYALTLKERWPEALVVLATGLGVFNERLPVGEAMDRAGRLLRQLESAPSACVLMDDVTAGLLGPGFQLSRSPSGTFSLHGEHLGADESRPLLGKPTPCVGREQELALLDMAFTTCVEDSTAQAVLVTAPAGTGKSRLRHEFLRRLKRHEPPALVLLGRGDPMSAGSADGLLGQALRRLCGISGGEPLEERQARLSRRLSQHLPEARAREVVAFLGELCRIPFADDDELGPRLHAARGNPQLMSAQLGRALVAFLEAECAHHPVLLVLEDLHWGDLLSVRLMEETLRQLAEQPFMVLALARPEVEQLLPGPWVQRLRPLPLRGLNRKAGARLVHEVLGTDVPGALVDRLVEQAAGNALFLEELIRGVAEGRGAGIPETVLAMLQARLGRLEPETRQVLLAASLFGRTFWAGGVRALLGGQLSDEALAHSLRKLVDLEWVAPQPASRFPGEDEYLFRHALVRDAAYGLVPDHHKPGGHRLTGTWLQQAGERDPRVLAEHASLGQQSERAIHFYLRAAEQLFERNDILGTARCVEAALALGARGEELVQLHALQATIAFWLGDFEKLFATGPGVLAELKRGSRLWYWLMSSLIGGSGLLGRHEEIPRLGQLLLHTTPEPSVMAAYLEALSLLCCAAAWVGAHPHAVVLLERMNEVGSEAITRDPLARGWVRLGQHFFHSLLEVRPWQALVCAEQGTKAFVEAGAESSALTTRALGGHLLAVLGDLPGAEEQLRSCLNTCRQARLSLNVSVARTHLAATLAGSPDPRHWEEARALAVEELADASPLLHAGWVRLAMARVAANRGEWAAAEAQAREACELLAAYRPYRIFARTLLSTTLLAQGRAAEAREVATLGVRELGAPDGADAAYVSVHLALAEAALAQGDAHEGEAALRQALRCVRSRASDIPDPVVRERFLSQVSENARTLALARLRWGEAEGTF
jgi:hypothetical protein